MTATDRGDAADMDMSVMLQGYIVTQVVAAAVRLGLPDHLAGEDRDIAELAMRTGVPADRLSRLLLALKGLDLVKTVEGSRYRATALMSPLRCDGGSLHGLTLLSGSVYYEAWAGLDDALRDGKPAFGRRLGFELWELFDRDDNIAVAFTKTMRRNSALVAEEVVEMCQLPSRGLIVDIGAGDGTLISAALRRYPQLRGIAVEQPAVAEHIRRTLQEQGTDSRCEVVVGDILSHVPRGGDAYMIKSVIHNWDDEHARRILANCRDAVGDGRLLLIEKAMNPADALGSAIRDLTMLVLFGSRDRTAEEYASLLTESGFTVQRSASGKNGLHVLDAVRESSSTSTW